jgi:hypothetical protein
MTSTNASVKISTIEQTLDNLDLALYVGDSQIVYNTVKKLLSVEKSFDFVKYTINKKNIKMLETIFRVAKAEQINLKTVFTTNAVYYALCKDEKIFKIIAEHNKLECDKHMVREAIEHNNIALLQFFCEKMKLRVCTEEMIYIATEHAFLDIIKYFYNNLNCRNLKLSPSYLIRLGNLEILKFLTKIRAITLDHRSLETACKHNNPDIIQFINKDCGVKFTDNAIYLKEQNYYTQLSG